MFFLIIIVQAADYQLQNLHTNPGILLEEITPVRFLRKGLELWIVIPRNLKLYPWRGLENVLDEEDVAQFNFLDDRDVPSLDPDDIEYEKAVTWDMNKENTENYHFDQGQRRVLLRTNLNQRLKKLLLRTW